MVKGVQLRKGKSSKSWTLSCPSNFKKPRLMRPEINIKNPSILKSYQTHDNGGRAYLVNIMKNDEVEIFRKDSENYDVDYDDYSNNDDENAWMFTKFVKKYTPMHIFIGPSLKNRATLFSGGYGSKFDGNSILRQINMHMLEK